MFHEQKIQFSPENTIPISTTVLEKQEQNPEISRRRKNHTEQ